MAKNKLNRLIDRFEWAALERGEKGGRDPATWQEIDREYNEARGELVTAVLKAVDAMQGTLFWFEHSGAVCEPEDKEVAKALTEAIAALR